jgi:hypothetical protein
MIFLMGKIYWEIITSVEKEPPCESFLHTFNMKICIHKIWLEVELLCSCSLTSKVIQCNAMKFTKESNALCPLEKYKDIVGES